MNKTRSAAIILWCLLVGEAWLLSPEGEAMPEWVWAAIAGDWGAHDPWVVAHFMLMGVWPLILISQTADRWLTRPVPLLPFTLGTMALGAFILLPGLALTGSQRHPVGRVGALTRHPLAQGVLALSAVGLGVWALLTGSPAAWVDAVQTDPFLHIMAFDSLVVWLTSVLLAWDSTQTSEGQGPPWTLTLLPVVGTCWWTARRQIEATEPS